MDSFNNNFNENIENSNKSADSNSERIYLMENDKNIKRKKQFIKLKKKAVFKISAIILGAVIFGNILGFGIGYFYKDVKNSFETFTDDKNALTQLSADDADSKKSDGGNPIINASDSVVSIVTASGNNQLSPFVERPEAQEAQFMGSGIIFHQTLKNIYIVTNYHVISGASYVNISFNNDNFVPANLVGKHQLSDLAVISVERENLKEIGINSVKTAYFGDSDKLNVGDNVIAIGNAFGDGNTATKGIVSVIQTDIPVSGGESLSVIQTDAAINMGNDGGALINQKGEVIGINTAKYSYYTVEGIGYSISSNIAKPIIEEIMNKKESPYLGVSVRAISEDIAQENNLPEMGVLVDSVVPGSAADMAGIKTYDVITGFNSNPVFTPAQLTEAVRKCNVGDNVEIKVIRNGNRTFTLNAVLKKDTVNNF